ncbi:DUF2252 domain-containing protein [Pseudonocardia asaccharolytica]|uniref:DUF2252 domain-containing protein n=1 Tax=Pseudonocardia asaccharolytica DSM 44247 = NBRC 16224 TaxID=1123024 RepID=A0A511CUC8_9PSEU|nr:DUF2252 domain-containing protein [Pseudonocardia asaccharolytica]GEL16190.1 hypothetical protein PA7_00270 [Pseudonocardia asaccharolytica DSM 44247 = NBRC 16224]
MTEERTARIVDTLVDAFSDLMAVAPAAFRTKFRKMAADPFAFYRGSACLFYADVAGRADPWADERSGRIWIQGDLHAENFGTYMDGDGVLIFDVNDFDEAYLGHFTWDVTRFAASLALLGWRKAISDGDITALVRCYTEAYLDQVRLFLDEADERGFALRLDNTDGPLQQVLQLAKLRTRVALLDRITETEGVDRILRPGPGLRRLDDDERGRVTEAFERYLGTIPESKRFRGVTYAIKDVAGRSGLGIGSAGLPAYTVLIEGFNQALDNDVVLSMKQGNVAAPSRVVTDPALARHFRHHGHRTAVSQRALQAHADPLLGYTDLDGVGFVVNEISPYATDLDWSELTEPSEIAPVVEYLGRATAKVHCVADSDADHSLVDFQTEEAITNVVAGREEEFIDWVTAFAQDYAGQVRTDHALFVDAFRSGAIPGVASTG